ncbi:GrpB family protein [Halalkalibacter suaedae]|uniref:GrpB family protein n=1 Tax=Halalkalibacter suaedae TaxID=2822140 RepID=A0A941ATG9_9BACI|nr:GrpB family protein [Bacillus suaedae]MBP3951749.1 GrpB family protein [Bacillus suaedae]
MRKTNIVPWTKEWDIVYKQEETILKELFKDELIYIFHIGSTSVQAIGYAKPIIDILVVVKEIENVDLYNEELRKIGYEPKGEYGIPGRRYFPKGKENRTHHVHIFQVGNEHINAHLDFKEYLIKHPEDAKRYGDLKLKLAKQFPDNHYKYQMEKQGFVNELVEKAKSWALQ